MRDSSGFALPSLGFHFPAAAPLFGRRSASGAHSHTHPMLQEANGLSIRRAKAIRLGHRRQADLSSLGAYEDATTNHKATNHTLI